MIGMGVEELQRWKVVMSITRVGSTKKFAEGWEEIFAGNGQPRAAAVTRTAAKSAAKKKVAKKKSAKANAPAAPRHDEEESEEAPRHRHESRARR